MKIIAGRVRLAASDVANFLACRRLTQLDLLRARGELRPPRDFDVGFQELVRRGEVHERGVLERFRADGLDVVEISGAEDIRGAAGATAEALRGGAGVVYQGTLTGGGPGEVLFGRPDFLVRADLLAAPDGEPRPGGMHYEVVDAKLARSAKARAVLQTSFYSHLLAGLQGVEPRWMHLALGNGEFVPFKVGDFAAYERQTRRLLEGAIGEDPAAEVYPEPVEHCAICRWRDMCRGRRRSDDDLSLVAGMPAGQRRALKGAGISTRRGFAGLGELPRLDRVSRDSLERSRRQARLQVASEDAGVIRYELLDPERDGDGALVANRGLLGLPEPAEGDLFFDIEGARYYSEDGREFGLQYLFGVVEQAAAGLPRYTQIWAYDRAGEKRAFEELIDFITERRARHPGLHVYHYNHYEPTSVDHLTELHGTRQEAVGALMGRFATREDEVDDLFRLGVFVDLYRVVRQGVRAGVESYSIKRLEPLCGYGRRVDLEEATRSLIALEAALEDGTAAGDGERQHVVAGYNEDDCRATLALRDWLEERRTELAGRLGEALPRPVFTAKRGVAEDPEVTRIRSALLDGVSAETSGRTGEERARALLADLLDWHRREDKPAWWRYFYVRTLSPAELTGEPDALGGLTGGEVVGQVKRSVVRRFRFPAQEHKFSKDGTGCDPATDKQWPICDVDDASGTIDLKVGAAYSGPWPAALVEPGPPGTGEQRDRLRDLGDRVVRGGDSGGDSGGDAATALLLRRPPDDGGDRGVGSGSLRAEGETASAAAVRLAVSLRDSYLPMQGPPGTGKTYTAAEQILELIADGRTAGITGPSHAVICHLIGTVYEHARCRGTGTPRIGQRADRDNPHLHADATMMSNESMQRALRDGELDVAAGTSWLWARAGMAGSVDTLFVDEAGQLSLANVLAVAGAARNLVLLGDPQQLAQPSHATHPPGAGASALEHILGERATMPAGAGLLLDQTWRMHPDLCEFTSEAFYDGKLHGVDGLGRQQILGSGSGLRIVEVPHQGNTNASAEEASEVARLAGQLTGCTWRDKDGTERPVGPDDVLIVTPYNAQIRAIVSALAASGQSGFKVGTVDKFQGREAPVVIYSMATSSAGEAPRGLEFLYDPHRLNVATSRARALAIIVASPDLIRVSCRTPQQMVLANALCRAWEMQWTRAKRTSSPAPCQGRS